jgi:hypothetical protein
MASGYKVQGRHTVDLSWSGASTTNVDVYRNGVVIATTGNDGFYTDSHRRPWAWQLHVLSVQRRQSDLF